MTRLSSTAITSAAARVAAARGDVATQVLGLRLVTGTGEVVEYTADRDPELLEDVSFET